MYVFQQFLPGGVVIYEYGDVERGTERENEKRAVSYRYLKKGKKSVVSVK